MFCSKVAKWPNLLKLKNRENDSGSNPPFALPSHARRKKEKRSAAAAQWCVILFHFARKRMSCSSKAPFLTCCMPLMFLVKCFGSSWSWWGKRPTSLDWFFTIWKGSMRNDLLSSTAVGIGSSSPVDTWINENSQKSICCRFTGFLLWIVGSLVKQMPKDSWIVSYKIADLLARCASTEIFQCPGSPNIVKYSSPCWKKPFRMVHWTPTFEVGWVRSSGEHQRPSTSQRLFASTMHLVYLPCCVSGCGWKNPWCRNY